MVAADDPAVVQFLNNLTELRRERDGLTLDLQQAQRDLAGANAKIEYLENALETMTHQRDTFMGRLIEAATHHDSIREMFGKADRALNAAADVATIAKTNGNGQEIAEAPKRGEPGELLSDDAARKIAAKYAPFGVFWHDSVEPRGQ